MKEVLYSRPTNLGSTVQNLVSWATWRPEFEYLCPNSTHRAELLGTDPSRRSVEITTQEKPNKLTQHSLTQATYYPALHSTDSSNLRFLQGSL